MNELNKNCSCQGCTNADCTCAGMKNAASRADCDGCGNCAQSGCTYAAKHRSDETPNIEAVLSGTASKIVMISVDRLNPHPDNPRKDVGDVSELAESIKANGILQNLTVVPYFSPVHKRVINGSYTVIIGHRRLAAAKLAGLTELPCAVANMTEKEQLSTMLTENMQRSDLTVYEQAQGFQLMLDLGSTVEEIAADTGFSQSTVRRRVKLLDLDREKFQKSVERGATLMDYAELDKIEDPALKNRVLEKIGTNNFKNALADAIQEEKWKKKRAEWLEIIDSFAFKVDDVSWINGRKEMAFGDEIVELDYVRNYGYWNMSVDVETPEDAEDVRYFYTVSPRQIDLYREVDEDDEAEETPEEKEKRLRQEEYERRKGLLEIKSKRHFELRKEFVKNFGSAKSCAKEIILFIAKFIAKGFVIEIDHDLLAEITGVRMNEDDETDIEDFAEYAEKRPEFAMLATVYSAMDSDRYRYFESRWDCNNREYKLIHEQHAWLDEVYDLLESIGYEMSDEEKAMRDGTHELLKEQERDNG